MQLDYGCTGGTSDTQPALTYRDQGLLAGTLAPQEPLAVRFGTCTIEAMIG